MQQHRPSILQRPLRPDSGVNKTTADAAWEREQEKLAYKTTAAAATQDRILRAYYPTAEDKAAVHEDLQMHLHEHQFHRLQNREEASEYDAKCTAPPPVSARVLAVADDKPWLNPSMVYGSPAEEKSARRRNEEDVAAVNKQMAAEAALRRNQAKADELQHDRQTLQQQSFWNTGSDPKDRFAPPLVRKVGPTDLSQLGAHYGNRSALVSPYASDDAFQASSTTRSHGLGSGTCTPMPGGNRPDWMIRELSLHEQSAAADARKAPEPPTWDQAHAAAPIPRSPYVHEVASGRATPSGPGPAPIQQNTGLRYASRPASFQNKSVAPWATYDDVAPVSDRRPPAYPAAAAAAAAVPGPAAGVSAPQRSGNGGTVGELLGGGVAGGQHHDASRAGSQWSAHPPASKDYPWSWGN